MRHGRADSIRGVQSSVRQQSEADERPRRRNTADFSSLGDCDGSMRCWAKQKRHDLWERTRRDAAVVPYTIDLLNDDGSIDETLVVVFEHDDAAIDYVGGIDHRHAIEVRQGDRHVALFPPLAGPPPFQPSRRR